MAKTRIYLLIGLFIAYLAPFVAQGQDHTNPANSSKQNGLSIWVGFSNTNWNNSSNWIGGVPGPNDIALIYNIFGNQPVITSPVVCNNMRISSGATVTVSNSALLISGELRNLGTLNASSSTITFLGSGNSSILGNPFQVSRLVINKTSENNTVAFSTNISIGFEMLFIRGTVTSDTHEIIFLDGSDSRDGSSLSYIDGVVRKVGNDAFTFPVGDNGVYAPIKMDVYGSGYNEFTAEYRAENPEDAGYDIQSIDNGLTNVSSCEYWMLNHDAGSDQARITLSYENSRSCGTPEPWNLKVVHWNGSMWENLGSSGYEGNTDSGVIKSVEVSTSFSPFSLGSSTSNNPLPVELIDFSLNQIRNAVNVKWITLTETNCDRYVVEKSQDLEKFVKVGELRGAGNSTRELHYDLIDDSYLNGTWYYRLVQYDFDGHETIYPPKAIDVQTSLNFEVYPNPANDYIQIISPDISGPFDVRILNSAGQIIQQLNKSEVPLKISTDGLSPGYYFIEVLSAGKISRKKIIKK